MNPFQGFFVLALACCCLLTEVSAAPAPIIDPLSATIGAAGAVCLLKISEPSYLGKRMIDFARALLNDI